MKDEILIRKWVRRYEDAAIKLALEGRPGDAELAFDVRAICELMGNEDNGGMSPQNFYNHQKAYAKLCKKGVAPYICTCGKEPEKCKCLTERLRKLWHRALPSDSHDESVIRILSYPAGDSVGVRLDPVARQYRKRPARSLGLRGK